MAYQNYDNVNITGGQISNVGLTSVRTNGLSGYLKGNGSASPITAVSSIPWSDIGTQPYIEVVDTTTTPIALSTTPQLLKPPTTVSSSGISYNSSTGVFTFTNAGSYNQVIAVNAIASASNQYVYIYAENWNGTSWVVNTNSGKQQVLGNNQITQVTIPNAVKRTAGQQVRYWIYSNDVKVTLDTTTLPGGVGAIVPAIRIQYS